MDSADLEKDHKTDVSYRKAKNCTKLTQNLERNELLVVNNA